MTRVLIGEALVNENERLQARINALLDKLEAALEAIAARRLHAGPRRRRAWFRRHGQRPRQLRHRLLAGLRQIRLPANR